LSLFLLNIVLALTWAFLTGNFGPGTLLVGFVLGLILIRAVHRQYADVAYGQRVVRLLGFAAWFLGQLIRANIDLAYRVLFPRGNLAPRVIRLPLAARTDAEITALANLITLTPGTLSVDVNEDRSALLVHIIFAPDPDEAVRQLKQGLERRLLEVTR